MDQHSPHQVELELLGTHPPHTVHKIWAQVVKHLPTLYKSDQRVDLSKEKFWGDRPLADPKAGSNEKNQGHLHPFA